MLSDLRETRALRVTGSLVLNPLPYPTEHEHLFHMMEGGVKFRSEHKLQVVEAIQPEGLFRNRITVRETRFQTADAFHAAAIEADEESFLVRRQGNRFADGMQVYLIPKPNGGYKLSPFERHAVELQNFDYDQCDPTDDERFYAGYLDPDEFHAKHPWKITRYITSLQQRGDGLYDRVAIRTTTYSTMRVGVNNPRQMVVSACQERGLVHTGLLKCGHVRLAYKGTRMYLCQ